MVRLPAQIVTRGLSVSEFAARIDSAVRSVGGGIVEGEAQEVHRSPRGHVFFDLTDGSSVLKCKVWAQEAARLQHTPKDGELVLVKVARPDLWRQRGQLSLLVTDVKLAGDGELLRRRTELIAKLTAEGLCDRARLRPLPAFPRAVGVISGDGSDGLSDVIRAIHSRFPPAEVLTCAAAVQGKAAPGQIIAALARLMREPRVDVILIARGGGSLQDLAAFDDERLCRAISACTKPVVCAIGHTPDEPVCNFVSHAAATPTHAPELIVPSGEELLARIVHARAGLGLAGRRLAELDARVTDHGGRLAAAPGRVRRELERTAVAAARLGTAPARLRQRAHGLAALCRGLSPRALLAPRREAVRALTFAIADAERAFFAERAQGIVAARGRLDAVGEQVRRLGADVAAGARRAGDGLRRQAKLHDYNYGRALARHRRRALEGATRRTAREADLLVGPRGRLGDGARRRLVDAERERRLVATRIEARDFRRQGYVLAADGDGRPVRSAAGLGTGDDLRLNFRDGQVGAVVTDTRGEDR